MLYQISRNGQLYGPYTMEDLRRYVASGNVLHTDLAKSESMTEWVPVSEILSGTAEPGQPFTPPAYGAPTPGSGPAYSPVNLPAYASSAPTAAVGIFPPPPDLNWVLLLVLGIVTCGIFTIVYEFIQAVWVKKVVPETKVLIYLIVAVVLQFVNTSNSFSRMFLMTQGIYTHNLHHTSGIFSSLISFVLGIGVFVFVMLYRFTMRSDLEAHFNGPDPIGLRLGPIMTFFFGGLYFQYHFNRINQIKAAAAYGSRSY